MLEDREWTMRITGTSVYTHHKTVMGGKDPMCIIVFLLIAYSKISTFFFFMTFRSVVILWKKKRKKHWVVQRKQ